MVCLVDTGECAVPVELCKERGGGGGGGRSGRLE